MRSVTEMPPALPCDARSPSKSRSISVTRQPRRCADQAQLRPTMPAPTTIRRDMVLFSREWLQPSARACGLCVRSLEQKALVQRIAVVDEDRVVAGHARPTLDARHDGV